MGQISPQYQAEAKLKLLRIRRKKALEGSFKEFIRYFFPIVEGVDFIFCSHHDQIIEKLEAVYNGECNRLIINIPPGYGKTELVVVMFSAWCYAVEPRCRFLHLSYADDLVGLNSVKIKAIINCKEFQDLWPTEFDSSVNGKGHWKTDKGEFRAVSTGGMVTGFRAGRLEKGFRGCILYDDPIKPEDAQSSIKRNAKNAQVASTIKSRLAQSETPIILIMQRVHDDDTSGYLLEGGSGDDWEHLNIPAIIDAGTENERALWPEKDPLPFLKRFQEASPYVFGGQYMGNPVPDDGVMFKRDRFNWYDKETLPDGSDYGAGDFASSDEATADFTELGVFRVTPDRRVYLHDWYSCQADPKEWIEMLLDFSELYSIPRWAGETGPIRRSVEGFMKDRMATRGVFFSREWFNHAEATKADNAQGFKALVDSGRVYLPIGEQWANELVEQLCRFPMGKFDDKVDTCSLFAKMINKIWSDEQISVIEDSEPKGLTLNELIAANKRSKSRNGRNRL